MEDGGWRVDGGWMEGARWRLVGGTSQAEEKLSRTKYFVDDMLLIFVRYQTTFYRQNHRLKRDSNLDRQSR